MKRAMKILSWTIVVLAVANAILCGIDGEWWSALNHINLMIAWLFVIYLENQLEEAKKESEQLDRLLVCSYEVIHKLKAQSKDENKN